MTTNFTKKNFCSSKVLIKINLFTKKVFFTKKNPSQIVTKLKNLKWDNLKTQTVTKLKKSNCDNLKTQIVTKHKNSNRNKTQQLITKVVIKLKK